MNTQVSCFKDCCTLVFEFHHDMSMILPTDNDEAVFYASQVHTASVCLVIPFPTISHIARIMR